MSLEIKTILCGTDFSDGSKLALEYASTLAMAVGAKLLISHVDDVTPGVTIGHVGYGYIPEVDKIAEEQLTVLKQILPTVPGVEYEHRFARGDADVELLRIADEEDVDLIVIGTHGRTGLPRVLMGSIAEAVVRKASCPVLTVKQPHGEARKPNT
jgi:universal stress protein A